MPAAAPQKPLSIALVDGDTAARRERQLMLRAQNFEVRSYATCAAVLADEAALATACIVADTDMPEMTGPELIRTMRAGGWPGKAVLLGDASPTGATAADDLWLPRGIADRPLLDAVRAAVRHLAGSEPYHAYHHL